MKVKHSVLAGSWYPAEPEKLREEIDEWLDGASAGPPARGVVVPHAGYRYSGPVAAAAYRRFRGRNLSRVVILAPSHVMSFPGAVVPEFDAFSTPLGDVPVDPVTVSCADGVLVRVDDRPFRDEHSLEIQFPFLQRVLSGFRVVPVLLGRMLSADLHAFASILDRLLDGDGACVVSSDFTHYGRRFGYEPFPADDPETVGKKLQELDMGAIRPILNGDGEGFVRFLDRTGATVCGRVPVAAFLAWCGSGCRGELVAYRTSLDVTGDYRHVVSYAAIAFPES